MTAARAHQAGRPHAQPAETDAGPSPIVTAGFALSVLFMYGVVPAFTGLGREVTAEPVEQASSIVTQSSLAFVSLFGAATIAASPNALRTLQRCWPLLLLPMIAMASTVWSVNSGLTLRRSVSYFGSVLLAIGMVAMLGPWNSIKLCLRMAGIVMIMSVVWALLFPDVAVHQLSDTSQQVHAGLWRGIWAHKVSLGQYSGLVLGMLLFYAASAFSNPIPMLVSGLASLVCLIFAGSASGLVALFCMAGGLYAGYWIAAAPNALRGVRLAGVLFVGVSSAIVILLGWDIFMTRVLGRSGDLTGRSQLWEAVWSFLGANLSPVSLGYGYVAGFRNFVGPQLIEVLGLIYPDSHSGYIDTIVAFGYPLAVLVFAMHALIAVRALRILRTAAPEKAAIAAFPAAFLFTFFVMNYAESHIMTQLGMTNVLFNVAAAISCIAGTAAVAAGAGVPAAAPARTQPVAVTARTAPAPRRPAPIPLKTTRVQPGRPTIRHPQHRGPRR